MTDALDPAGPATQVLWTDISPSDETGFNDWYNREHVPDRVLRIPGFVRARRFAAVSGGPKYATVYETASADVFSRDDYLRLRREPDARSRHFIPRFQNVIRVIGAPAADHGIGEGGHALILAFVCPVPERLDIGPTLNGAIAEPGIIRGRLFLTSRALVEASAARMQGTTRSQLRHGDRFPDGVLLIEGMDGDALAGVSGRLESHLRSRDGSVMASASMRQIFRLSATN